MLALICMAFGPSSALAQNGKSPGVSVVTGAKVAQEGELSVFALDMSVGVKAEIFTLPDPWRVVIELPGAEFKLPPRTGEPPPDKSLTSLVRAFRYGAFAQGASRIVIDTTGPAAVAAAGMKNVAGGVKLEVTLAPTDASTFGAGTGASRAGRTGGEAPAPPEQQAMPAPGTEVRSKPLIMIDPGHGGVDPGAVGSGNTTEKAVVLAVAWQLKRKLDSTGRYETRLTRTTDVFVTLDKRVAMAEEARADLFLSLHADAIDDSAAQTASGASIYTLSDRASDEQARKMAEKENAADLVAGIGRRNGQAPDEVKGILSDLWARENSVHAHLFSRSLVGSLQKMKSLSRQPERSAAFRVLKQSHAPAVLIELGFLSNPAEEQRIASPEWQKQVAASIGAAIDTYFQRRKANAFAAPTSPGPGGLPP